MGKSELKNRKWKSFKISEIFITFTGASISQDSFSKGKTPRITASDTNNGISLFTTQKTSKNYRTYRNFISISFLGSVFYHQNASSLDMKIHGIVIKDKELNPNLAQFLITCLKSSLPIISYGNQLSSRDLQTKKILLPINDNGNPDWEFMENYIAEKSNQIKATYQLPKPHTITDYRGLDEVEWGEFNINKIFTKIERGKRHKKSVHTLGSTPYISSTKLNNGCDGFIGQNSTVKVFKNCLTIANSGSVGSTFYHDYSFVASDHVTALINPNFSKNHYLFIAGQLSKLSEKYSFNREINDKRIKREVIRLPSKIEDGKTLPDLDFMENYMKRLENKLISEKLSAINP